MTSAPRMMGSNPAITFSIILLNRMWYENIERPYAYLKVDSYKELLTADDRIQKLIFW